MNGSAWYRIERDGDTLRVQSNGDRETLGRFLQLELNAIDIVAEIVAAGPELEPYMEFTRGLRVLRYADPLECIFTFLCTANNHVSRISTMVRHLASYGPSIDDHPVHRSFPGLERLAELSETELRVAGFGYRAATLPVVAAHLLDRGGQEYVEGLKGVSLETFRSELVSLPSIGPKLADCMALFGFGFREAVPVDTHIWKAATRLYFPHHAGSALTPQKYEEFATFFRSRFGAHAGWAHQALFYDSLLNWRSRKKCPNGYA